MSHLWLYTKEKKNQRINFFTSKPRIQALRGRGKKEPGYEETNKCRGKIS